MNTTIPYPFRKYEQPKFTASGPCGLAKNFPDVTSDDHTITPTQNVKKSYPKWTIINSPDIYIQRMKEIGLAIVEYAPDVIILPLRGAVRPYRFLHWLNEQIREIPVYSFPFSTEDKGTYTSPLQGLSRKRIAILDTGIGGGSFNLLCKLFANREFKCFIITSEARSLRYLEATKANHKYLKHFSVPCLIGEDARIGKILVEGPVTYLPETCNIGGQSVYSINHEKAIDAVTCHAEYLRQSRILYLASLWRAYLICPIFLVLVCFILHQLVKILNL